MVNSTTTGYPHENKVTLYLYSKLHINNNSKYRDINIFKMKNLSSQTS